MEYNNCFLVMSILHIYIPVVPIFTNHQFTWCVILPPYTSLCNTAPRQRKLIFVVICICFFYHQYSICKYHSGISIHTCDRCCCFPSLYIYAHLFHMVASWRQCYQRLYVTWHKFVCQPKAIDRGLGMQVQPHSINSCTRICLQRLPRRFGSILQVGV